MKKNRALPAALALMVFACGCGKREDTAQAASAAPAEVSVPAVRVARADITGSITLTGEFTAYQEVDVMAKVAGYILRDPASISRAIASVQGQVLATLEMRLRNGKRDDAGHCRDQSGNLRSRSRAG